MHPCTWADPGPGKRVPGRPASGSRLHGRPAALLLLLLSGMLAGCIGPAPDGPPRGEIDARLWIINRSDEARDGRFHMEAVDRSWSLGIDGIFDLPPDTRTSPRDPPFPGPGDYRWGVRYDSATIPPRTWHELSVRIEQVRIFVVLEAGDERVSIR